MKERLMRMQGWLAARFPHADFWEGSARGLRWSAWVIVVVGGLLYAAGPFTLYKSLGILFGIGAVFGIAWGLRFAGALVVRMAPSLRWGLAFFVTASVAALGGYGKTLWLNLGLLGLAAALLGGGLALRQRRGWTRGSTTPTGLGALLLSVWLAAYWLPGWPTGEDIVWQPITSPALELEDPGQPGPYDFTLQTYGSGSDPQRREFASEVDHVSASVDGSKLIDGWEGRGAWGRSKFWGISAETLPLQGRAWIPEGQGPFPMVLIVHGNHGMEDFSDTGYAYLGELFASRGIIAVSVDQNFLNSSHSNGLGAPDVGLDEENDARGWLLLKHLEQWRAWNADPDHPLAGKADLRRVALIGHSRGGEAVSEAAVFNTLPAYPDDATLDFDFDFGLRGVIAIAPVDSQYDPRDGPTTIRDVNYLVIHGSHDGDVTSYAGYATYARTRFQSCADCFKTGFYLIGANHGQFNTSWGRRDSSIPRASVLNLHHIMDARNQRAVAETLFSAFLEVVLFDNDAYRPWLAAPDRQPGLFPDGVRFLSQFQDAREVVLADYSEDDDVTTGTLANVRLLGQQLALWREQEIELKWREADTAAAVLGWQQNTDAAGGDVPPPSYTVKLPPLDTQPSATLNLSLAPSTATPGDIEDYDPPAHTDFSLALVDTAGRRATLPLSTRRPLLERVEPRVFKLHALQDDRSEIVFQRYRFELAEWLDENPELDLANLRELTLVFDRTAAGAIILEQITLAPTGI